MIKQLLHGFSTRKHINYSLKSGAQSFELALMTSGYCGPILVHIKRAHEVIMARLFYYYPIIVASIDTFLHLLGSVGLYQREISRGGHMLWYSLAILVVIGLSARSFWTYWLALLVFLAQAIAVPFWAYQSLPQEQAIVFLVPCPFLIVAVAILLFKRPLFYSRSVEQTC